MNEKMFNKENMADLKKALKSIISDGKILGGVEVGNWYIECHEKNGRPIADVYYGNEDTYEKTFQIGITNNGNYTVTSLSSECLKHEMAFVKFFNEVTTGIAISSLDWNARQACKDIQERSCDVCFYLNRDRILKAAPQNEYDAFIEKNPESGFTLIASMKVEGKNCQVILTEDGWYNGGNHIAAYFCNKMNEVSKKIKVLNADDFTFETPLSFVAPQQETTKYPIVSIISIYVTENGENKLPLDAFNIDLNKIDAMEGLNSEENVKVRIIRDGSDSFQLVTIQPEIWDKENVWFVSDINIINKESAEALMGEMLQNPAYPAAQLVLIVSSGKEKGKGIPAFEIWNPNEAANKEMSRLNKRLENPITNAAFHAMKDWNRQEQSVAAEGIYNVTFGEIKEGKQEGKLVMSLTDGIQNGKPRLIVRTIGECDENGVFHPEEIVYTDAKAARAFGDAIRAFNRDVRGDITADDNPFPYRKAGQERVVTDAEKSAEHQHNS